MPSQQRDRPASRREVFLGRSLAQCAHPLAAWRLAERGVRVLVVAGYFTLGYVVAFLALTLFW